MEEWRDIPGFEGYYQISNQGRIRSAYSANHFQGLYNFKTYTYGGKLVNGYRYINLIKPGKKKCYLVHRLVGFAFVPGYHKGLMIDHIDTNRENNTATNLRWVTFKGNAANPITLGRMTIANKRNALRGEKNVNAKKISQLSLSGVYIQSFGSVMDASVNLKIPYKRILHCVNGEQKSAGGYLWKYI